MPGEIDSLEIKIAADSQDAKTSVDNLAFSLKRLGRIAGTVTSPITKFAEELEKLKINTAPIEKIEGIVNKINSAMNELANVKAPENITNIAQSLSSLSSITESISKFSVKPNFSADVDALKNGIQKVNEIGNEDVSTQTIKNIENLATVLGYIRTITQYSNDIKVDKSFSDSVGAIGDGVAKLNSIGNDEISDKSISNIETLSKVMEMLGTLSPNAHEFKIDKSFMQSMETLRGGIAKMRDVGSADIPDSTAKNVEKIAEIVSTLSAISPYFSSLNVGKNFTQSIEFIGEGISKLNQIWNNEISEKSVSNIETLSNAMNALSNITPTASAVKIDKSFTQSAETLSDGVSKLSGVFNQNIPDNAIDNIEKISGIVSALGAVAPFLGSINVGRTFGSSAEAITDGIAKLNGVINLSIPDSAVSTIEALSEIITALSAIAPYANGLKVNKSFEQSVDAIGAGITKLNSFGEVSLSENTVASLAMLAEAMPNLSALAESTKGLQINIGFADSVEKLGDALQKVNSIGNIQLSEDTIVSIKKLDEAIAGLAKVSESANGFKIGRGFTNSIDTLSEAIPKLNELGSSGDVTAVSANVQNLNDATANLKNIAENIKAFSIGTSFSTNIDYLKAAINQLESLKGTGEMTQGIENLERGFNRMNSIDVGDGAAYLLLAAQDYNRALGYLLQFNLGASFNENIDRIARAAETLANVDFSGFERMNDALSQIPENVSVSFGASTDEVQSMISSLTKLSDTVETIKQSMAKKLVQNSGERETTSKIDYQWSDDEVRKAIERADAFKAEQTEVKKTLDAYKRLGEEVPENVKQAADRVGLLGNATKNATNSAVKAAAESAKSAQSSVEAAGKSVESTKEQFTAFQSDVSGALTTIGRFGAGIAKLNIGVVMSPLKMVGNAFVKAAEKANQLWKSLKRIAMYRAIRAALKAISEGFKEGRENLYQYSLQVGTEFAKSMDKAATAALYLKNSIGAATAPLTNYLVPIIDRAVDSIVELINKFNELSASLMGAQTWTKALKFPKAWAEAADDATDSAKKLKSTVLGFDELNVIEPKLPTTKSSEFTADDYSKMFTEMQTDYHIQEKVQEIIVPIKLAWDNEGDRTLESIKTAWNQIKGLVEAVGASFREVWLNGTGQQTLETIAGIIQGIVGTVGNLAAAFTTAWEEAGLGTHIVQGLWDTANIVLQYVKDVWADISEWAQNLDFTPLLEAFDGLVWAVRDLLDPSGALYQMLRSLWTKVLLPIGKWLIEKGIPKAIGLITSALRLLGTVLEKIKPIWDWLANEMIPDVGKFLGGAFDGIATYLTDGFDTLTKLMNGEDVSGSLAVGFWSEFWDSADDLDGSFWEDWLNGAKDIVSDSSLSRQMQGIGEKLFDFDESIKDWWNENILGQNNETVEIGIKPVLSGTDALTNPLEEDWAPDTGFSEFIETWGQGIDVIRNFFSSEWNGYIEAWGNGWQSIKDTASELWNGVVEAWSTGWTSIKDTASALWNGFIESWQIGVDSIKEFFTQKWESYKTSWQSGWETISKAVCDKWTKVKNALGTGWATLKSKVADYADNWKSGFTAIWDFVSEKWESLKNSLSSGWDTLKDHVSDFADDFKGKFNGVKTIISTSWADIKKDFNDGISEFTGNWSTGIGDMEKWFSDGIDNLTGYWSDGVSELGKTFSGIWTDIKGYAESGIESVKTTITNSAAWKFLSGIGEKISGAFSTGFESLTKTMSAVAEKIKKPIQSILDVLESLLNSFIEGLNYYIGKINNALSIDIPDNVPVIGGTKFSIDIPLIPIVNLAPLAGGGIPQTGQMFIAREAGAELVGRVGSRTAVMNNEQIVSAVSDGVYRAMMNAMSHSNNGSDGKPVEMHVHLDGREITSTVEQTQRERGIDIFSGAVFV